jgi:hypothetical protein
MNYDREKVDEITMALLRLVMFEREEGLGARAWKGFDWDTMERLHAKGWISDPKKKTKSIRVTEEGVRQAEAAFQKHFVKNEN